MKRFFLMYAPTQNVLYSLFIAVHIYGNLFVYLFGVPNTIKNKIIFYIILFFVDIYLLLIFLFTFY